MPTVMVMAELPAPGAGIVLGLRPTVVPAGAPDAERLIELSKPAMIVVVMVDVPLLPCTMVREAGEAEIPKSGGNTISVTVVFCLIPPPVAFTVIGYVPGTAKCGTVMVMVELPAP